MTDNISEESSDILEEYRSLSGNREFESNAWLDDLFKKNRLLAEIQALEACDWLKETGFPQYAHMYQDGQMPIDLEAAQRDHTFLDEISLRSLFCRLDILNKCFNLDICPSSEVKLRSGRRRRDSGQRLNRHHEMDSLDNDDDVEIALSNRWTYEPHSHRWSRSCEGESSAYSPTNLEFQKPKELEEEEEEGDEGPGRMEQESDEESNISEVNGSGLESSSGSKSLEDLMTEEKGEEGGEETLKRKKKKKIGGGGSKFDSGLNSDFVGNDDFLERIDRMCPPPVRRDVVSRPSKDGKLRVQRVFSHNDAFQFENLEEYFEPDYRDIFDSLADLSKSLFEDQGLFSKETADFMDAISNTVEEKKPEVDDDGVTSPSGADKPDASEDPTAVRTRRKQMTFEPLKGHSFDQSMTSSFSSSTSSPSSHSSLSMASYTLHSNPPEKHSQSGFKSSTHQNQQHQQQQRHRNHHHQQQQLLQQQHQNLSATLSSRSENSYLTNRIVDFPQAKSKRANEELEKFRVETLDGVPALVSERKRSTMYASRDSFSPSECNLASRYCFPRTPRHRQPIPPSPLLTRAADKLRGAFNFLRKIDNSGSVRRSLKKKPKRNVENAEQDFIGGLVKNDISPMGQGHTSNRQEGKTLEASRRLESDGGRKLLTGQSSFQNGKSEDDDDNDDDDTDADDVMKMKAKSMPRKMSTYDNVCTTQDFDRILDDIYSNIFLLDQSLLLEEADEDCKSPTGSLATPSSSNDSQGQFSFSPNESQTSSKLFPQTPDAYESDTLKSKVQSPEVFKNDEDDVDSEEEGDDSDDERKWRYPDVGERERRDSGVGSSLTRRPSNRRTVRWQSFLKDDRSSSTSSVSVPDLAKLSAQQMLILEKYCLLRITSILEKYGSISRKSWKNLIHRKRKTVNPSDYPQRAVFGVPLEVLRIRHGQALPKCVLLAMKKLRRSINDCDGIFRKAGAKSRVQALKDALVADPESIDYEESSVHDLADMLKAFLKELPECLFTGKFSKILTNIFKNVPKELHAESVQACLVLMPNEHRDCLHTFMLFCHYLANHSHVTQMNASNLALCLSPSFFHLETNSTSAPGIRKHQSAYRKCIDEQRYVHQCLTFVVENAPFLFSNFQSFFEICHITPTNSLCSAGYLSFQENMDQKYFSSLLSQRLKSLFQLAGKEAKSNSRGWSVPNTISSTFLLTPSSLPSPSPFLSIPEMSVEVSYKKQTDLHPLRLWKFSLLIEAPPIEVLTRILWDRHIWDFDLLKWRRLEKIDNNTEVFQYVLNSMAPHPPRLYSELRSWKVNLETGSCTLVCQSLEYPRSSAVTTVSAEVQSSHCHIEPCGSGRCRLTLISRIDFKGATLNWYNYMYDYIVASQLLRISLTLKNNLLSSNLPETKV